MSGSVSPAAGACALAARTRSDRRAPRLRTRRGRGKTGGFTYLGILFVVAFIGVGLAVIGQVWSLAARRADEAELLFVGDSFRHAIQSYYRSGRQFPRSLADLVADPRTPTTKRHIRKLYADPITRSTDWRLITLDDGSIIGVASKSKAKPLKVANFNRDDAAFEGKECYCDWEFVYAPASVKLRIFRKPTLQETLDRRSP